jgi:hypothetical protein
MPWSWIGCQPVFPKLSVGLGYLFHLAWAIGSIGIAVALDCEGYQNLNRAHCRDAPTVVVLMFHQVRLFWLGLLI